MVRMTWSRNRCAAVMLLAGTASLVACGDSHETSPVGPALAATITLAPSAPPALTVGDTLRLTATVKDASGGVLDHPVTWASSDTASARITSNGLVTAWGAGSATITATSDTASASTTLTVSAATPVLLAPAAVIGKDSLPPGDTPNGGQGQAVGDINCETMAQLAYHIHAHLSLIVNGEQLAIPLGIGTVNPQVQDDFVTAASCFYWLHTHDASGIVHIEPSVNEPLTLGQFFDIWGQPLTSTSVAGFSGPVTVFVDGAPYTGDPRAISFTERMQITLEVGTPLVPPPVYQFPDIY